MFTLNSPWCYLLFCQDCKYLCRQELRPTPHNYQRAGHFHNQQEGRNEQIDTGQSSRSEAQRSRADGCGPYSVLSSRSSPSQRLRSCTFPKVTRLLVAKDKTLQKSRKGPRFISPSVQNHQARLASNPLWGSI